jgi:hypothetical protein
MSHIRANARNRWIPAYAGMTEKKKEYPAGFRVAGLGFTRWEASHGRTTDPDF